MPIKMIRTEGHNDAWRCDCGNTPDADGFYPCDEQGIYIEPDNKWIELYVCDRCGKIITNKGEMVGQAIF